MNLFGKVSCLFFSSIVMIACATVGYEKSTNWVENKMVTVAWDPETSVGDKSASITEGYEINYLIYIKSLGNNNRMLTDKYVEGILLDKETPIAATSCTIKFQDRGQFAIGIQSVIVDKEKNIIESSSITWSNLDRNTNNNPFAVRVVK
jgi:hypothetical protein